MLPTMPLIPAIWPLKSIISAVARPMSNPPMSPLIGVKFSTIVSFFRREPFSYLISRPQIVHTLLLMQRLERRGPDAFSEEVTNP
jgi:hypothetical protein